MAKNTALSIPKMVSASNKCKKRRHDAFPKAQAVPQSEIVGRGNRVESRDRREKG